MSKRRQIEMSKDEIQAFLAERKTIIICSQGKDGFPHPMPMWFRVAADGAIHMSTFGKSQKVMNLRRDPRCSLLAESGLEYAELKGVVYYGKAEIIEDTERIIDTMLAASGSAPGEDTDPKALEAIRASMTKSASKRVLIRIVPDRVVSWDHSKLAGGY